MKTIEEIIEEGRDVIEKCYLTNPSDEELPETIENSVKDFLSIVIGEEQGNPITIKDVITWSMDVPDSNT